jgi:hypothetical protein
MSAAHDGVGGRERERAMSAAGAPVEGGAR